MENPNPTFSIIVPVYKVEQYLCKCLDSILGQSNPDFELILVDDGSTDRSGGMCDEYAAHDERIRVIHKSNGGQATARNAGLDIARGRYIFFIDSDDWLEPDTLEVLAAAAKDEPDAVVFSFFYRYDNAPARPCASLEGLPNRCSGGDFIRHVALNRAFDLCVPWNKLYRRSMLEKHGVRFVEGIVNEDGPFVLEALRLAEKVTVVPQNLYSYRKGRADATTSGNSRRNFDSLLTGATHVDALLRGEKDDEYVRLILLHFIVFAVTQRYRTSDDTRYVVEHARKAEYRKMLRRLLHKAHFSWKIFVLGTLVLLSPAMTKKLLKTL